MFTARTTITTANHWSCSHLSNSCIHVTSSLLVCQTLATMPGSSKEFEKKKMTWGSPQKYGNKPISARSWALIRNNTNNGTLIIMYFDSIFYGDLLYTMASILNGLKWPSSLRSIFSSLMVSQIVLHLLKFGKMSLATIIQSHIFALVCTSLNTSHVLGQHKWRSS